METSTGRNFLVKIGHRLLFLIVLITVATLVLGAAPSKLSPFAEGLARTVKFDRQVLVIAMKASGTSVQRLVGYDENDYQIMADGICVTVPEDRTDMVLHALREKLMPLHYLAFVSEMNTGIRTDKIGILKGNDQYDIIRVMHTGDDDDNISNDDVIERLKTWEKESPFDILGADNDWLELEFKVLPKDLKAFAQEVYDFCPAAVDEGPGSLGGLISNLRETKRLFLSWE